MAILPWSKKIWIVTMPSLHLAKDTKVCCPSRTWSMKSSVPQNTRLWSSQLIHISCSEIHRYPSNNLALLQSQESCSVFVLEHKKSARGPAIISSVACLVTYLTLKQDEAGCCKSSLDLSSKEKMISIFKTWGVYWSPELNGTRWFLPRKSLELSL